MSTLASEGGLPAAHPYVPAESFTLRLPSALDSKLKRVTNREITTRMHRLFRGDLSPGEYVHLLVDDQLNRARVNGLLARCIPGSDLLIFVDRNHCGFSSREEVFEKVRGFLPHGRVKIADPRFQGRVIIEPLGVGAFCAR